MDNILERDSMLRGSCERLLDVFLDLFCVTAATYEDFLDSRIGKELKSIFNQRGICEREEALFRRYKPR